MTKSNSDKEEWVEEHYDNGQLCFRCLYVNRVRQGTTRWYHPCGSLSQITTWINGELHGMDIIYSEEGVILGEILWYRGVVRNDLLGEDNKLARLMLFGEEQICS